jgi:alkylated DNA nucleotide flippase Atl1
MPPRPKPPTYWRVINNDGSLREKTPGGIEHHKELLEKEGHTVITVNTKRKYVVQNYENKLIKKR